ncbi:MAG: copper resistance protein CopC [Candidatus Nitrosotalea sp.]|nr:copper resistance protein CopC [Candidatus Nitrosotalea sp.]
MSFRINMLSKPSNKIILSVFVSLFVLAIISGIPKSYEHAFVIDSSPAPASSVNTVPSQIEIEFVDPIDMRYSQIKVMDANGKSIQNNDWHFTNNEHTKTAVSLPPDTPNGIYTVYTKVLDATDGHSTTNAFVFAIGQPIPQNLLNAKTNISFTDVVSIPDSIARYPSLVGQIIVVGAIFSSFWLWRPVSRISALNDATKLMRSRIDKSTTKIVLIGSIIILAGDVAMIVSESLSINSGILEAIGTTFGNLWIVRMVLSLALFGMALFSYLKQKKSNTILSKSQIIILFALGIAILTTTTLISHGAASGKLLPPILDFIHNVVASLWIGGVIYLTSVVAPKLRQAQDEKSSISILLLIIPQFSTITITLLGLVMITGPFLLYALESNLSLTLASIYGEILIIKLSLATTMIGIGAFHHYATHRNALRSVTLSHIPHSTISQDYKTGKNETEKSILTKFDKSIKIEAIIGLVLIASIAILVDSGTPSIQFQNELVQQQQQIPHVFAFTSLASLVQNKFTETSFTNNGNIILTADPFLAGKNNISISFVDSKNNPININSTKITLTQVDKGIGPIAVNDAVKISQGVFSVDTAELAIPGHWQAQVEGITTTYGALNVVTNFNDLYVKPNLNQLQANITEFKMPDSKALPLYPIYDPIRNVIWVGDTEINSGRIWEFDLNSKQYTEHKINGTNIITGTAIDFQNNIWYIDPITKIIGQYMPDVGKDQKYHIPNNGTVSGIVVDNSNNIWLTVSSTSEVLKLDTKTKTFQSIKLPDNSVPLGISIDQSTGQVWVAESGSGKIADIDPAQNYKIIEYSPFNSTLASPTNILFDSVTNQVFVSEHDGKGVSAFDPLLKTFKKYNTDPQGLPFGMVFDANHDLWLAQHTLNKIAVIDPRTGKNTEFNIPSPSSFTQWATSDSQGDIIIAEQRANALGIVTTSLKPGFVENTETGATLGIPLGVGYTDVAGPSIAAGLVVVAFFYSKGVMDLRSSVKEVKKSYN